MRLLRNRVTLDARAAGVARRDAHPKAHGLVCATFIVGDDVPTDLRHGLFEKPGRYDALIRFSNGMPRVQADDRKDMRGMAIKLPGVNAGSPGVPDDEWSQDFVLASAPCFFIRTIEDYAAFARADVKRPAFRVLGFFFPLNPFRWKLYEFRKLTASLGRAADLLATRYWSQVPYRCGPHIVKYSAIPTTTAPAWPASTDPDFLRRRMVERLDAGSASFDFMVQQQADPVSMPVEDSTILWDEAVAPFRKVASIEIPQQAFDTPERRAQAERLSFSPWHTLDAHQPLGSVNAIRRKVYPAIAATRRAFNDERAGHMSPVEPTSAGGRRRSGMALFLAGAAVTVFVVALSAGYLFWRSGRGTAPVVFANGATVPDNSTGLAPQERQQYYHLTEGGEIWPVAALLALETADPSRPGEYVPFLGSKDQPGVPERFGMLPDPVSDYNPYGLPVGVTVAQHGKIQLMGLNCTACHVGELQYQGKRFRVDGAPNMAFVNAFVKAIADETGATLRNPERSSRFLHRLSDARKQLVPLKHFPAVEHEYGTNDGTDVEDPFGGDDVGSWLRSLASRLWHQDAILESRKDSLRNMGYLTGSFLISPVDGFGRADAFGVGRNALFGGVDLGKEFPKGTNSAPSDAPVSFPHTWGMKYTSWLQWGANTNSVMERNVGQSLGVGAAYDPKSFISTVRVDNLAALEDLSYKIEPPKWPEDIFGAIDRDKAAKGKLLFDKTCALCHETYPKTKEGLKEYQLFPLNVVGTDPATALNFERLVMPAPSGADAAAAKPFGSAAFMIVGNVLQKYYADLKIPDDVRKRWEHRELRPDQEFRSTMREAAEYPDTRGLKVYRAKTLRGIWATAPYLHNGSVPTIYDLLLPAAERPVKFTAGTREFDPVKLGMAPSGPMPAGMEPTEVDTTLPGNWNGGHEWWFYPSLTDEDRYAIIEFVKSFWLPNADDYSFTGPADLPKEVRSPYPLEREPGLVAGRP